MNKRNSEVLNVTGVVEGLFSEENNLQQCVCCTGAHRYSTTINLDKTPEHINDLIRDTVNRMPSGLKVRIIVEVIT